jgi:hypothetical protein
MTAGSGGISKQRREPLDPPVDGDVVDLDPALGELAAEQGWPKGSTRGPPTPIRTSAEHSSGSGNCPTSLSASLNPRRLGTEYPHGAGPAQKAGPGPRDSPHPCGVHGSARPARIRDSTAPSRRSLIRPAWPGAATRDENRWARPSSALGAAEPVGTRAIYFSDEAAGSSPARPLHRD